ncbi:MAG: Fe-S cluster assembly protein SufD [Planctomycetales bacterium]|jgi:Fe-S cluster assembly protein SufD
MSTASIPESSIAAGFTAEVFEEFLQTRDEPEWVTQSRRDAFDLYQEKLAQPLAQEEWKRVGLRAFRPGKFQLQNASSETGNVGTLMQDRAEFAGSVVHVDGHCVSQSVSDELKARGVLFGDLATMLREHGDTLRPHFATRAVEAGTDRFSAWHAAFWTGGALLFVPSGVKVEEPLYSLIGLVQDGAADFSHTLVILEDNAEATLLEETSSSTEDAAGLHVGAVELLVGKEARLQYVQLQNWNGKTWHFAHQSGRVAGNGSLQWTVGGLGSKVAHVHQDVHLDGRGAEGQVNGVTFATNKQLLSYYTQQTHHAPDTRSDLLYKDVLRDKARCVWRGMIKVDKEAQQTDGYQRNDSLMLSSAARCDAIPGLEIEADDVRCTHGATAGRVDVEQVFYAMCRGLTEYEAMHMIVQGFFQTVTDRIPVELVRHTLDKAVERKLGIGE